MAPPAPLDEDVFASFIAVAEPHHRRDLPFPLRIPASPRYESIHQFRGIFLPKPEIGHEGHRLKDGREKFIGIPAGRPVQVAGEAIPGAVDRMTSPAACPVDPLRASFHGRVAWDAITEETTGNEIKVRDVLAKGPVVSQVATDTRSPVGNMGRVAGEARRRHAARGRGHDEYDREEDG